MFASPQFIFGHYDSGGKTATLNEECLDNRTLIEDCSSGNSAALAIFIISSIILSFPATVLYSLTTSYIDEIVYPRFVSLHIGVFNMFLVIGPVIGFLFGSACLSIYVDPEVDTILTESDPAWVGAWWIPFVIIAIASFILAIPFLMFPKWLPDSYLIREERRKEMAKVYTDKEIDGNIAKVAIWKFPTQIKRLLLNTSYMCAVFGLAISYIFTQGVISFAPKYLENQFYFSASTAGIVTGLAVIPSASKNNIVFEYYIKLFYIPVEPLNKGHIRANICPLYREIAGPLSLSIVNRLFLL